MTSLTLLWRSIRYTEGWIIRFDDLKNDNFHTKSASFIPNQILPIAGFHTKIWLYMHLYKLLVSHLRLLFAKFGWNWFSGPGEDVVNIILLLYLLGNDVVFNSLPLRFSILIGPVFQERGAFKLFNEFLQFRRPSYLKKLPSPKDVFAKFGWNWPSGSGGEDESKSLQPDRQNLRSSWPIMQRDQLLSIICHSLDQLYLLYLSAG